MTRQTPDSPDISENQWVRRIDEASQKLAQTQLQSVELLAPLGSSPGTSPKVIFAGSFNPLHAGHCQMANLASEITGEKVHFELSIVNADKPEINSAEICRRLLPGLVPSGQLTSDSKSDSESATPRPVGFAPHGLLLSNHAPFVRKAAEYGEVTFVVGIDTWIRIADESFYPPGRRDAAIDMIAVLGCRFLVFGRAINGEFQGLAELARTGHYPDPLIEISDPVPESQFRLDVSSADVRGGKKHDLPHNDMENV